MTKLLLKLFIRGTDPDTAAHHAAIGKLAGSTGIACNILLCTLKIAAGLLTGSVAIIGDGINNLTDSASSLVTLLGFRMAQQPADKEHPFGHGRYEYISGLVVAALVLVAGVELAKSSFKKILVPQSVPFSAVTLVILLISVALKFWMSRFYHTTGDMIHSMTLEAAAQDSRNDVLTTSAVIIGFLVDTLLHIRVDGIMGLGVAAFILWSGFCLGRDTLAPLLGTEADAELVQKITDIVLNHDKVLGIHDLLIHDYGPGRCFASVHAEMDAGDDPLTTHNQLDHIEQQVLNRLGVQLVIHCDPVVSDKSWDSYHAAAEKAIAQMDSRLTIHDLRVISYQGQSRLAFDLAVPFDFDLSDQTITARMLESLKENGCALPAEIHIDRKA